MEFRETNLNFKIKFKWNDNISRPYVPPYFKPGEDEWIEVQLWEFMDYLGQSMVMGSHSPVQTEILVETR